ncbi:putative gluconate 2-dehydrogenase subunit 3 [Bordetella bronchiseptica MBORD707]|nr:putative gluconate 2-dehydrogenase subunit 3 [Bordetella bronchiseptica MBORD707]
MSPDRSRNMSDSPHSSRREFLLASGASAALTGIALTFHAHAKAAPAQLADYKPEYFTPEEWAFVLAATARLIPSEGEGPGALEAHVPIFLDRQLKGEYGSASNWYMEGPHDPAASPDRGWQTPLNPAQLYRKAIPAVNAWCQLRWSKDFKDLAPEQQDETLTALQKGEAALAPELSIFFTTLLANTKEGYFADPMHGGNFGMQSWVYIGFPGARASYAEWVDQHNVKYPLGPVSIKGERA